MRKEHGGRLRVCLAYPNTYSVGMANLGFQSVYMLLNAMDGCVAERAFLPDSAAMAEHARTGAPLTSYESQTPAGEFDLIAFSVPFEDDYLNIPVMLGLAGVSCEPSSRQARPLVAAGGVAASLNPEPLAGLMDFFIVGEAEPVAEALYGTLRECKERGLDRRESLLALDALEWVYVPSFYDFVFDGPRIREIRPRQGAKPTVKAAKSMDLAASEVPRSFVYTPDTEFRDTYCVEVERGCGKGCRFCAAGFLYLPPRMRPAHKVNEAVGEGARVCGKVGLVGAAVSEYPGIKELLRRAVGEGAGVTLSSLRLDELDPEYLALLREAGYRTITLAPEAATGRMREVINKGVSDEQIMEAARLAHDAGFRKMKLYFLVGLPTETDEDAQAIVDLSLRIRKALKGGEVSLSVNPFVPKPFTPFQWHGFEDEGVIEARLKALQKGLGREGICVRQMPAREALCQAYLSRADRRAGELIVAASKQGWKRAAKGSADFIAGSVRPARRLDEPLAWDVVDHGLRKEYLWKEYLKGLEARGTPPCVVGSCTRCGVC